MPRRLDMPPMGRDRYMAREFDSPPMRIEHMPMERRFDSMMMPRRDMNFMDRPGRPGYRGSNDDY